MLRIKMSRAAVAAVAIGAVPLGSAAASTPDGSPPAPAPADSVGGAPPDIEFQIDMMLGLVPQEEMDEYYEQQNLAQQEQVQACMNAAGFEYNIDTNSTTFTAPSRSDEEQLEWARQWGFGMWTTMDPETQSAAYPESQAMDETWVDPNPFLQDMSADEQNAWYEQSNRCFEDAYNAPEDDPWSNPMVQQAMEDFQTWVESDARVREAEDAWRACMADAGQPFVEPDEMYQAVFGGGADSNDLQNQFYESEAWRPDSPDHEQWQSLVDQEIAIAVADATCSPPLNDVMQEVSADLRPRLIEAWQDVDWDLPPVTYPEIDLGAFPGDTGDVPADAEPGGTADAPVGLDLSGPADATTAP